MLSLTNVNFESFTPDSNTAWLVSYLFMFISLLTK